MSEGTQKDVSLKLLNTISYTKLISSQLNTKEMAGNCFEGLVLSDVTPVDCEELGRGAYGRVYAVKYCGTICAAKEIHSILVEGVGQNEMQRTVESFCSECHQCSKLRHPNVIQFMGVYFPPSAPNGVVNRMRLPVMVMEMMSESLTSFVNKHETIPSSIKFSIVHDVSLGLCYLHNHNPPIVHRDLSPNNVLLTAYHVAKISDLGVAKVISNDNRRTMTKAPGTVDFMPPESFARNPIYGTPMDVFSFAGIMLHLFNQKWPTPSEQVEFDSTTRNMIAKSEVQRRQLYLDRMTGQAAVFKPLIVRCLDNDPAVRPAIIHICGQLQVSKDVYLRRSSQRDIISLCQQVDQLRSEAEQQSTEMKQLRAIMQAGSKEATVTKLRMVSSHIYVHGSDFKFQIFY